MIKPEYRCQNCDFHFTLERPRPTICPRCNYNYIDWLNSEEVLDFIWNNVPYYIEHGYSKQKSKS